MHRIHNTFIDAAAISQIANNSITQGRAIKNQVITVTDEDYPLSNLRVAQYIAFGDQLRADIPVHVTAVTSTSIIWGTDTQEFVQELIDLFGFTSALPNINNIAVLRFDLTNPDAIPANVLFGSASSTFTNISFRNIGEVPASSSAILFLAGQFLGTNITVNVQADFTTFSYPTILVEWTNA